MSYRITVGRTADKSLKRRVSPDQAESIRQAIDSLAYNPHPRDSRKLQGREGWRIRVGDYRIIYFVDDEQRYVEILSVGHRRDVYR